MADSTLGVIVFPDMEELDALGPWEVFGLWHALGDGPRCLTVGADVAPIRARHGLKLVPDVDLDAAPPLDYVLVPGGRGTHAVVENSPLPAFVARQASSATALLSVCTGLRVLHAAQLLDGRRVTTHHSAIDEAEQWTDVTVVRERYVRDGRLWTAAGISAGLDMALAVIAWADGPEVAARVQREAEYFPEGRRYGARGDSS